MRITINQQCKTPYFRQITNQLKNMIVKGEIPEGTLLPSERVMAELCHVHRNTVIKAYHELKADGLVTSSQGKGYRTACRQDPALFNPEPLNWNCLIREKLQDMDITYDLLFSRSCMENKISFAGGLIAPDVYSDDVLESLQQMLEQQKNTEPWPADLYHYIHHQGTEELRTQLAMFYKGKGINVSARQIQVVSDVNQAIAFLGEMLLAREDSVLVEEPMSPDLYRTLQLKDVKVIPVPTDGEGIVTESVEGLIQKHRPKLIFVNSSYHDPSGVITPLERRQKLLSLSYRYGLPIVEIDSLSELYLDEQQVPSYAALDRGQSVIYLYSFSMTFTPGVRVACVVAPRPVIENMGKIVAMRLICFDTLSQMLLYHCLKNGIYQRKLEQMRSDYRKKRDLMYKLLQPLFDMGAKCELPRGGVYLWLRLPDDTVRVEALRRCAEKKGVMFVPGFLFFPFGTGGEQYIRLNYSFPSEEQIRQGIPLLIDAVHEAEEES